MKTNSFNGDRLQIVSHRILRLFFKRPTLSQWILEMGLRFEPHLNWYRFNARNQCHINFNSIFETATTLTSWLPWYALFELWRSHYTIQKIDIYVCELVEAILRTVNIFFPAKTFNDKKKCLRQFFTLPLWPLIT